MKSAILILLSLLFFNCIAGCTSDEDSIPKVQINKDLNQDIVFSHLWETFYLHLDHINRDSAFYYADSIKSLATLRSNKLWLAKSNKAIAYLYQEDGLLKNSTTYYLIAAKIFKDIGELEELAGVYVNIGSQYYDNQDYHNSLIYYTKAIDIYHYYDGGTNKAIAFRGVSMCHIKLNHIELAEQFLEKAKEVAESAKDHYQLGLIWNLWGSIKTDQNKYPEARSFYLQTLACADSLTENKELIGIATNNIGEAYLLEGNNQEAKNWFFRAISIKRDLKNPVNSLYTYNLLAKAFINEKEYLKAANLLEEGLNNIEPGAVDNSIDDALAILNNALIAISEGSDDLDLKVLNQKLSTYNQQLLAYNQSVSETSDKLKKASQQQAIQETIEKHALQEQLAEYEKRNTYMQYAFLIPIFFLICAVVSVLLAAKRNMEYKKLYSKIEETLNKSRALRQLNKK